MSLYDIIECNVYYYDLPIVHTEVSTGTEVKSMSVCGEPMSPSTSYPIYTMGSKIACQHNNIQLCSH